MARRHALADMILVGDILPCYRIPDDCDARCATVVGFTEVMTTKHRRAERAEATGGDEMKVLRDRRQFPCVTRGSFFALQS